MKTKLSLLLLFFIGSVCHASVGPPLEVWVYSLYPSTITRHKVHPFIEHLGQQTQTDYTLTASSDSSALLERCAGDGPALVLASLPIAEKVNQRCGYGYIAVTYQDVFLYVLKGSSVKTPRDAKRIAVVRDIEATKVAIEELNRLGLQYDIVEYPTFYKMMSNFRRDKVQAAIFNSGGLVLSRSFKKKWEPIYEFSEKGVAAVLLSPKVGPALKHNIIELLLSNDAVVSAVFQDNFGLGPFQTPKTANDELLK